MRRITLIHISMILAIILSSCATDYKRWPSGGIEDRISPTLTFYTPQEGSLNQDRDITAEIEFSEFIDHASTRNAITVSPYSVKQKSKVTWYEKSVKIEFSDLEDDQTVLIVVNTSLRDLRKNNIKDSFILNFSTGNKIDKKELSGNITGAIIGESIEQINYSRLKVDLFKKDEFSFYEINNINPEYSVGVSSDMSYKFTNVSSGNYVPVVYYDKNNNSKLETNEEYLSFSKLVDLKNNDIQKLDFTIANSDTIPPFINQVTQIEEDILKIELSEDIISNGNTISTITQD
ncbi:MAG: Ig-like domain-containing protein, partial [Candidatus Delongbacteria bacterium]|nr:Ig-like domain-containing protein [Candidatus Delongbacteria bacterium]